MVGKIFISYRREDSAAYAGRLYDHLSDRFTKERIFMDIDTIGPGEDFSQVIQETVDSCHVFIAVIGKNWLTITDKSGNRRLDNPKDFVRLEIARALDHKIRVIPVLVDGAHFPEEEDLPDELAPLVRHNALEISDKRFHHDTTQLITAIEKIISLEQEQSGKQKNETEDELRSTLEEGKVDHFPESAQFSKPLTSAPPGLQSNEYCYCIDPLMMVIGSTGYYSICLHLL